MDESSAITYEINIEEWNRVQLSIIAQLVSEIYELRLSKYNTLNKQKKLKKFITVVMNLTWVYIYL